MMGKVISLGNVTRLDLDPDQILDRAKGSLPGGVVIMGWDEDEEVYFASSIADGAEVLWLMEMCKKRLLEVDDE
jgi:hypothetical protein